MNRRTRTGLSRCCSKHDLDGQVAAEIGVAAFEDGAHAAAGDLAEELVPGPGRPSGISGEAGLTTRPSCSASVSRSRTRGTGRSIAASVSSTRPAPPGKNGEGDMPGRRPGRSRAGSAGKERRELRTPSMPRPPPPPPGSCRGSRGTGGGLPPADGGRRRPHTPDPGRRTARRSASPGPDGTVLRRSS